MEEGKGKLVIRTIAMPSDTNANGDIFGGWLLSQMDLGGASLALHCASGARVATVAIDGMTFIRPVKIGDAVCCYASVQHVGKTSIQIRVEAWREDRLNGEKQCVTDGMFTFVAIDDIGRPMAPQWQDID
jgi:acyl-CoA thioesterase YciA